MANPIGKFLGKAMFPKMTTRDVMREVNAAAGTHASKTQLFYATIVINPQLLNAIKSAPDIARTALDAAADYWHTKILPLHFARDAAEKYDYAPRTDRYLRQKRKRWGGRPDLMYSGSLRRDLTTKAAIKQMGSDRHVVVELRMWARVLNFVPNMNYDDTSKRVKHSNSTHIGYPNMKREIRAITPEENEALAAMITENMTYMLNRDF
ncbi:MAG: hypothetical protein FWD61_12120 [Phycisphaerales bacterium]|nr:hypothetical protein [Phycisphaerales bacterium]